MMRDQDEQRRRHWKIRLRSLKIIALLIAVLHFGSQIVLLRSYSILSPPPRDQSDVPPSTAASIAFSPSTTTTAVQRRDQPPLYAYASIIGGCNPDKPGYRGYLYTVLMSWRILQQQGSKADFCLFIQMSNQYTTSDTLPERERQMLQKVGIQVYNIPKVEKESFYASMMDKFRILDLTRYRRVLFLDADLLALGNLDYLFVLSDNIDSTLSLSTPLLQPNLVLAGALEPASGGFFMLQPGKGKLERLQGILADRDARNKTGRFFNTTEGWGHAIDPTSDPWKSTKKRNGTDWGFPGSHADQGLLYHWVKYVERNVSLVIGDVVENWSNDMLMSTVENPFSQFQPTVVFYNECLRWKQRHCVNPYKSIVHYTGRSKPWLADEPPANIGRNNTAIKKTFWWYRLSLLNDELDLGLDFERWKKIDNPTLGFVPAVH